MSDIGTEESKNKTPHKMVEVLRDYADRLDG